MAQLLGLQDPGGAKFAGTWTASRRRSYGSSQSLFQPLVAGDQKASLPLLFFSISSPIQALEGSLPWDPSPVVRVSGTQRAPLAGVLLCSLVHQSLKGATCLGSSSVVQCV